MGLRDAQRLLQAAVVAQVCSAAALAVVHSSRPTSLFATGRTSRQRLRRAGQTWVPAPWPGSPVDVATPFDLASLTKPMATSTIAALLVQSGQLDLDAPVGAYLADAASGPLAQVPLRLLLCHASGLPAWRDFFASTLAVGEPGERAAAVRAQVLATPLTREVPRQAVYSDLGFMVLGWCLERAAGAPLSDLFRAHVATPLGISAAFRPEIGERAGSPVIATEVWATRCPDGRPLCGVVHDDNCAALQGVAGHAGLFASVHDVSRWALAWLRAARGEHNALSLLPELAQAWLTSSGAESTTWRMGWDTPSRPVSTAGTRAPEDCFGHLGFTGTSVWASAQADTAVVLLTNRVHPHRNDPASVRALRIAVQDQLWPA